jgi:colicin import membrane protein
VPVAKKPVTPKESPPAKRIPQPKKDEKPVVIAKRTVEKKAPQKKSEPSPSKMIDEAVSKIKEKVAAEEHEKDHLSERLAELEKKVGKPSDEATGGGAAAGSPGGSIRDDIYRAQVAEWIRSNWSYPVALGEAMRQMDLEAVVVVQVDQYGKILNSRFVKRSANGIFDQSVEKAVERSDPVPPFPEGYRKSTEELEVRFNLSELEELYS